MLRKFLFLITTIAFQACTNQEHQEESTQNVNKPLQINWDSTGVDGKADKVVIKTFKPGHFYTEEDLETLSFSRDVSTSDERFNLDWTNGVQWFSLDQSKDVGCAFGEGTRPYIHLSGGDRHEGGVSLFGILQNDSTIHVLGSYVNDVSEGDLLRAHNFNGVDCLVVLNADTTFKSVIVDANLDLGNDEDISVQKNLAGRWGDPHFGNEIEFFNSGRRVIWNGEEKQFHFESGEYEQLLDVFTVEEDSYYFKRSDGVQTQRFGVYEGQPSRLALYKIDKEKYDWQNLDYVPEYFDTEYLLQEPSKELSFEMFKNELKAIFK
tara:strand:+ start:181 stop:1143 length:963 start_codon:yes stop_codon:yes gene_type:complete